MIKPLRIYVYLIILFTLVTGSVIAQTVSDTYDDDNKIRKSGANKSYQILTTHKREIAFIAKDSSNNLYLNSINTNDSKSVSGITLNDLGSTSRALL